MRAGEFEERLRIAERIASAVEALREAENRFNMVTEEELVDAAVLEITAARIRLNYLLKEAKLQR